MRLRSSVACSRWPHTDEPPVISRDASGGRRKSQDKVSSENALNLTRGSLLCLRCWKGKVPLPLQFRGMALGGVVQGRFQQVPGLCDCMHCQETSQNCAYKEIPF